MLDILSTCFLWLSFSRNHLYLTSLEALTESSLSFSQDISQQQYVGQNDTSMELINSIDGIDEEGRSRQRILAFAAKRFYSPTIYLLLKSYLFVMRGLTIA